MESIYNDLRQMKMERYDDHKSKEKELSSNSLKTYGSIIKNLYKEIFKNKGELKPALFDNKFKEVVKYLEDYPINRRRNLYTALYSYTNNETYQKLMTSDPIFSPFDTLEPSPLALIGQFNCRVAGNNVLTDATTYTYGSISFFQVLLGRAFPQF
jgi:hypothetical protein